MTSRRAFLQSIGCSLAASPLVTPVTLAAAPWDNRLVVIVLRGAMDGLDVVQPYGDPGLTLHRQNLKVGEAAEAADLDGFYALHPGLHGLLPLWRAGELSFAHAVSTPYRDKRSHFDGQDLLEGGGTHPSGDGWLNRLVSQLPGATAKTAFAVGRENLLLLSGQSPASSWSPDSEIDISTQGQGLLQMVYAGDPLFRPRRARGVRAVRGKPIPPASVAAVLRAGRPWQASPRIGCWRKPASPPSRSAAGTPIAGRPPN